MRERMWKVSCCVLVVLVVGLLMTSSPWAGVVANNKYKVSWYTYMPGGDMVVMRGTLHILQIETKSGEGTTINWKLTGMRGQNIVTGDEYVGGAISKHKHTTLDEDGYTVDNMYTDRLIGKGQAPNWRVCYSVKYAIIDDVYVPKFDHYKDKYK